MKNSFLTVSPLGGSGGLERNHFYSFSFGMLFWPWKNSFLTVFPFGRVWWSWKNSFFTVSPLGGCVGLELILSFSFWEGVLVLKELIFNSWYFGRVCFGLERTLFWHFQLWKGVFWSWKNSLLTFSTLGGCVLDLKELICNIFNFGRVWWSWKDSFLAVSPLGWCGGLERNHF